VTKIRPILTILYFAIKEVIL